MGQRFRVDVDYPGAGRTCNALLAIDEIVDRQAAGCTVRHRCGELAARCPHLARRLADARERLGAPRLRVAFAVTPEPVPGYPRVVVSAYSLDEAAEEAAGQLGRMRGGYTLGGVVAVFREATGELVWRVESP